MLQELSPYPAVLFERFSNSLNTLFDFKREKGKRKNSTLITVQWYMESDSQGRGLKSLLGTPEGTLLGMLKDRADQTTTMNGTP